jgi:drug/metabolite transporter (DMT)-like permease
LVTFLIPIIALFLGATFLDESVSMQALAGMAIIALGLVATDERLIRPTPPSSRHRSK